LLDRDDRVIVVTAKADWWGLKLSADGKHPGYPVVVFGSEHQDLPLHHLSGKTMAELLGTGNRSAVLQMREWMPGERTQFWIDFASNLFRLLKGKLYLVIDEVHNFAPKGKILDPKAGAMLHWSNKLASEARGIGITLIGASQRPAKVHNDFLTSCETLIAMRVTTKWDREAVRDWIDGCGDRELGAKVLDTLAQMKRGDAWVWSPEIEFGPQQVHFPMFTTYDSFRPQTEKEAKTLKGWAEVNLEDVRKKLEYVVKEAEANDPAKLKARIRELEKGKPAGKTVEVKVADPRAIERAVREARAEANEQLRKLGRAIDEQRRIIVQIAQTAAKAVGMPVPKFKPLETKTTHQVSVHFVDKSGHVTSPKPAPHSPVREVPQDGEGRKLKAGAMRMLEVLAQWHPDGRTRDQLGALAGFAPTGGTFSEYLSALRTSGFIRENGVGVEITEEGMAAVPRIPARPDSPDELIALWKSKFKSGIGKMLDVLVASYPEKITREELGERTGFAASGGTFSEYLSALRRARLIDESGGNVGAAASLMEV
jgi:uncharacterized protein